MARYMSEQYYNVKMTITILECVEERQDDKLPGAFSYDGETVNLIFTKNKLFDILDSDFDNYDLCAALPIHIKIKIGDGIVTEMTTPN